MADATNVQEATEQEESAPDSAVEVQEAELAQAQEGAVPGAPGQIGLLLDSTVSVSAMLGQTEMQVRELLGLGPGSVVKLDRAVGQPVDLHMRGILFARGQLVVVGEQLAIRIGEIVAPPADQEPPAP